MAKLTKDELLKAVEEMTVLQLADFVKALEEKFGVSAQPVTVGPAGQAAGGEAGAGAADAPKNKPSLMWYLQKQVPIKSARLKQSANSFRR